MAHLSEFDKKLWLELNGVLENILHNRIGLTEGCRKVYLIRDTLDRNGSLVGLFTPFIGYEAQSETYPLGRIRNEWSEKALAAADRGREKIEADYRERLLHAARNLLDYGTKRLLPA